MNGVIVSVKGRYAVLLNKNGEFVKVKNRNYSVGDKVKIPQYKGQIIAVAASFIVVCGGISSYFVPAKYMSVDINPSVMMTINIYNRVINTKPLNDDAQVLLSETDVNGMSVSDSMDELIKKSEEIGYLNEHNKDVIVEVVDGIGKIKLSDRNYGDVEVIIENADKADLKNAKEMGVSIAKAKAIAEYTKQNGGSIEENADKLEHQSVKEIRRNLESRAEVKSEDKIENKTDVVQKNTPVQKAEPSSESRVVQKTQPKVYSKTENVPTKSVQEKITVTAKPTENNTVRNNTDSSQTEDRPNDMFDEAITKTMPNPIQEERKDEPVFKPVIDDRKTEERIEEPIQKENDKADIKDEITIPSETVKPMVSEKPAEQDKPTEEVKPKPSYGGHITPSNRPNNSNKGQEEIPKDDNMDKPNGNTENTPSIPNKDEEKPPQGNPNNQPQEPQNPDKPFEDMDKPQENNPNNRPQEPNFNDGKENPDKPNDNPQPPFENDKPPQEPNGGNNQSSDFNEPTGPSESNDFGGNKNDVPPEHNNDFSPPSGPHESDNSPMPNDGGMPNFNE